MTRRHRDFTAVRLRLPRAPMTLPRLAFITICVGVTGPSANAQQAARNPDTSVVVTPAARSRIDSALSSFVADGSVAGVSALIWEEGREVYFNAFGMADREAGRPMRRDAIVQVFSMTKPITGVALMTLWEQGQFQLDEPLAKYLPEFGEVEVYAGAEANGEPVVVPPRRPITIRDITRHTAGFATGDDNPALDRLLRDADPSNPDHTLAQLTKALATVPLAFHPGAKWRYGPSVDVQARLVEVLSDESFESYVRRHVLDPLGMQETRYFVPKPDRSRLAALYDRSDTGVLSRRPDEIALSFNTRRWRLTPGSYGLTSTVDDYMRFARMLVNGGELDGARILRPETVQLMATSHLADSVTDRSWLPSKGSVGFGIDFAVRIRPPQDAAENNGVVGEFFWDGAASTLFWVDPVNELAAVLFVQLMPFDRIGLHKGFRDAVYGPAFPGGPAGEIGNLWQSTWGAHDEFHHVRKWIATFRPDIPVGDHPFCKHVTPKMKPIEGGGACVCVRPGWAAADQRTVVVARRESARLR